jgi:pimeloyl-ACP methyl ester carboxylesterase
VPYIDAPDVKLYYEDEGTGTPIVFLHGFTLDRRMWRRQVEFFKNDYRTIAYDSRGHGKSGCPESNYARADRLIDLHYLVEELMLPRFHIVGLSMGGATALGYAIDYPDTLLSLTLVDTAAGGFQPPPKYKDMRDLAMNLPIEEIKRRWQKSTLFYYANKNPELKKEMSEMMDMHCGNLWTDPNRGKYKDRDDVSLSKQIKLPTLIYVGENDKFFIPLAKTLHDNIQGSEIEIIPGVGHMSNMEAPDRFNHRLEQFLERVGAGP